MHEKTAYDRGIEAAFQDLGMDKEAFISGIARAIGKFAPKLISRGMGMAQRGRAAGGIMGRMRGWAGRQMSGIGTHLGPAAKSFGTNPGGTLGQGAWQYGKGLFGGGGGLGGKFGRGTMKGLMGYSMMPSFGGSSSAAMKPPMQPTGMAGGMMQRSMPGMMGQAGPAFGKNPFPGKFY